MPPDGATGERARALTVRQSVADRERFIRRDGAFNRVEGQKAFAHALEAARQAQHLRRHRFMEGGGGGRGTLPEPGASAPAKSAARSRRPARRGGRGANHPDEQGRAADHRAGLGDENAASRRRRRARWRRPSPRSRHRSGRHCGRGRRRRAPGRVSAAKAKRRSGWRSRRLNSGAPARTAMSVSRAIGRVVQGSAYRMRVRVRASACSRRAR